ncbi:unnamed protein product [Oreochromis niloticus]|nr:unnamed protein product [Mustela putorius furo]
MANPIRLLILLSDNSSERMDLSRMPDTVEELIEQVKESCKVAGGIRLQYKDVDFGGTFVNLNSTSMIKDLTTIKVIPSATETLILEFVESDLDTSSISTHTDDTVILSSSSSEKLCTEPWPKEFNIPQFSFETEGQLEKGNAEYTKDQTRLTPTSKMLSDILERLAEKIFSYKAYPSDADLSDVAEALTRKHPCLRQPDSFNESYGWKLRLKTKMSNYRTQLKSHGLASELLVNTLKSKSQEDPVPKPAKNNKKARRGEANYYPQTSSENPESLELERISLLTELKKRNNEKTVREKMARTFEFRRKEVVDKKPDIKNLLERWPGLFQMEEDADADIRRECILKSLIIYLGERVEDLIKEYMISQKDEAEEELQSTTMALFVFRDNSSLLHQPRDIGIIIDGVEVLNELPSVAAGVAMVFGLCYALNMEYPRGFRFTFEALQKIMMELDFNKMTSKIRKLNCELNTAQ